MKKEMKVPEMRIEEIYANLKKDLKLCVKYHRRNKSELVKEYFWTDKWEEIEKQLQVICKPFSAIQKIQISGVITELHNFYILLQEGWTKSEKPLKKKSKSLSGKTTSEA